MKTRVARLYAAHDLRVEQQEVPTPGPGQVLLAMEAGGICGSDLHYYHDGGFGPVRVREPIISGHEASGRVVSGGDLPPGTLVAVSPSQPCGSCDYCAKGLPIHCLDMHFIGSAMRLPHEQGMFRDLFVVDAAQIHALPDTATPGEAACAEPLAVCLHAVAQARDLLPDLSALRVMVTGAGPIGLLVLAALRHAGARDVIVTDLTDAALARARQMGAGATINVATDAAGLEPLGKDKGRIDLIFDCSAAGPALRAAFAAIRPRGTIIQVGVTGDITIPLNALVGKEVTWRGSQRFHAEFPLAVDLIGSRAIDVRPIISHSLPLDQAVAAFEMASDRSIACKVQLTFAGEKA
ncbi:L-idonate 5-dehydrogenase [Paracoccus shanxieyensis]|uniref:Alcohol dehydrogenase catalytic domain-containing protein n=1 Tax=Paracoccus shanxieyensis TaxID=2675752 RepID=A0A6L6J1D7_9RHOB|nr:L-idonate 5-dehydrogenase [Paracoccus shanxieyensis]MTH64487.1 alcohol dehydrogenase catalytic domain-containing protein [Paracoccus shanxieyensis]MTH87520.1 alcohol dehydrogenase catalytic domain-containing protein [Paracoccus shanxieyensis]